MVKKMAKCKFDKKDGCSANVCFSNQACNSRDEHGGPIYILTKEEIKMAKKGLQRPAVKVGFNRV